MINITQEEIMKNWQGDINQPVVSVRCITYNHENYIAQALDGFLMQKTNFPFEVIVHDDASPDKTADIVREYEKKYPAIIKAIYQTENQYSKRDGTIARIMNEACKGKYIALCEGDDYWIDENKLQMQVDFLEENPEYGMCFHGALEHFEDGTVIDCSVSKHKVFSRLKTKRYSGREIILNWIIPTASIVMRSVLILDGLHQKVMCDQRIIAGDKVFWLLAITRSKVWCISKTMSIYRRHRGGVIYSFSFERGFMNFFQLEALIEYFPKASFYLFILKMKTAASNCSIAILKKDFYNAWRFFKLNFLSNIFLLPLYLCRNLFQISRIKRL